MARNLLENQHIGEINGAAEYGDQERKEECCRKQNLAALAPQCYCSDEKE